MRITKVTTTFVVLVAFAVINVDLAFSQDDLELEEIALDEELEQELKWLQAETYVITPSKIPETIKKTASSITVVTDRQIRQMGAKNLDDVIQRVVPSFWSAHYPKFDFLQARGLMARALLMINGLPLYDADFQGGLYFAYHFLNMDNVKRIEFIRGPGSALYGANAFHGVINIITKKAEDVDGVELTARGGSWDTQQYNLLFGKTFSELEVVLNLNYFKTRGHSALIKEDRATLVDQLRVTRGFPPISLTPGYTKEDEEKIDLAFNVKYKGFMFDGGYTDRQHNNTLNQVSLHLTEKNNWLNESYYLNLAYETALGETLDLSAKAYTLFQENIYDSQNYPPGMVDMWFSGSFGTTWPEGWLLLQKSKNSRTGMEIQATYKMSDSNTIVAGATYEKQEFYDHELWQNWWVMPPQAIIRYPLVQKIPEEFFLENVNADFKALFLEDVWDITEDLRLTLGARYDDYSSFGGHFSPRAGLTWEYKKGYDLKLLYGHAFSVPAIGEIVSAVPGTTLGPQTIDSYELSLGAEFTSSFESRITLFRNDDKDLITRLPPSLTERGGWTNLGELRSQGVEVEARYDFGRGTYVAANYSYTSMREGDPPRIYLGKIMSNIRLSRYLNLYVDGYHIGGWNEEPWDLSDYASGRTIANATLIARKFLKGHEGLELRGSVYNLFDEDYAIRFDEGVPYGWPQPGINFLVEVEYRF